MSVTPEDDPTRNRRRPVATPEPKRKKPSERRQERRGNQRILRHGHAEARRAQGPRFTIQIMNISEGGVRFVAAAAIPKGERLRLWLEEKEIAAEVCDCRKLYNGFSVRVRFAPGSESPFFPLPGLTRMGCGRY